MSDLDSPATESPMPTSPLSLGGADVLADYLGENVLNEIYMYLFHRRSAQAEDVVRAGFAPEIVPAALTVLFARGLITPSDSGRWDMVPPSRSLPSLAARLEERARLVRTSLPGLTSAYRDAAAAQGSELHGVEFLPTTQEVAFAITQCIAQAPSDVTIMRRDSIASRKAAFQEMPSLREGRIGAAERAVRCTTVLHTDLVRGFDSDDLDWIEPAGNQRILLSGHVPFTVVVSSGGTAVVEMAGDHGTEGFLVNHPDLVRGLAATVELVLSTATPWERETAQPAEAGELTASEREILHLLSLGVPDATIARRLGISSRTFDRRLRAILDTLGAATRFQAGLMAARRGWL